MRVFVAGATGTIEWQLVPRLVAAGHEVHRMTRSESKHAMLYELGRSGGRRRARELEVEEADDAGVREPGGELRFAAETPDRRQVVREPLGDDLDGYIPPEPLVPGAVDVGHAAHCLQML